LKQKGISRVRPLAGGLNGWREKGFPVTNAKDIEQSDKNRFEREEKGDLEF
jgi:3-mercaptopyruvate sulfurtransferase SseA